MNDLIYRVWLSEKNHAGSSEGMNLLESFGGVGNKVYFVTDDQEEASTKVFWRK